ncbi:MAG TPA: 3-oxoacyl-[acyl-carrier-protein] reductase [Bacteroidetes bacterium]|nr:3-oxoacyl-[acyl-carrier-protein] reductase [Bacteroidota bacterium]
MSKPLADFVCIVTGGSRGIGRAIAIHLAKQGAHVAITYVSSNGPAQEVVAEIESMGSKAMALQSDASKLEEAEAMVESVVEAWGKIDVLVNNAGITRDQLILRMSEDDWNQVLTTNLKSVFNGSKAVAKTMMRQRNGSVINVGSIIGLMGNAGQSNYAASKAGMIGFTKSFAKEFASRGIRANVIAPGYITTDMTESLDEKTLSAIKASIPLGEPGSAEDVANLVSFLASNQSSYITGEVIRVDGGMAM